VAFHPPPGSITLSRHAGRLVILFILAALSFVSRKEGFIVPLLVYMLSFAMTIDYRRISVRFILLTMLLIAGVAVDQFEVIQLAIENSERYKLLTQDETTNSSIGYYLLYELPEPLSTLASMVLLLFIQVPFWRRALFDSYTFFMTMGAMQMLFIAPAFLSIAWFALIKQVELRFRYLIYILLVMLLITSLTSKQVRHFAIMYPGLMIVYLSRSDIIPPASRRFCMYLSLTLIGLILLASIALEAR
jgi:hypothetical protein